MTIFSLLFLSIFCLSSPTVAPLHKVTVLLGFAPVAIRVSLYEEGTGVKQLFSLLILILR